MRFSTFLRVPSSAVGCWSFQAGHHFVATNSPNRVRAFCFRSKSAATASSIRPRSITRFSASARRLVRKMPAERCRVPGR
jgi:hypothetical protein